MGCVGGGGLDDARQQRALGDRQLRGGLVEVHSRRRLDAVGAVAEVDGVQIGLQNLPLVHHLLQLERQHHLLRLPRQGFRAGQVGQLDELLGDGGRALGKAHRPQVLPKCPEDPVQVHAVVTVEAQVLRGDEGLLHLLRHRLQRHPLAPGLPRQRAHRVTVAVEHLRGPRRSADPVEVQPLPVGKVQRPQQRRQQRRDEPQRRPPDDPSHKDHPVL